MIDYRGSLAGSEAALMVAGMGLTLALSCAQALISLRIGSDHPVHTFIARNIRANAYRLFVRIPRLLNTCYCAAVPLYLHWIVAHFRSSAARWCERLLNPLVNTLHVAVFALLAWLMAREAHLPTLFAGLATCAFALTPQFYHALSARNFGLSSRGIGLLLLTVFMLLAYQIEVHSVGRTGWVALALCGWLIWGFSTFAQQALCILSLLLVVIGRHYAPLIGTLCGLVLFIALHARYALGYLIHTLRYIRTYQRELASIYILAGRYSIWRDLVWDIWTKIPAGLAGAARYAYGNSVLIVVLLNPLVVLACWGSLSGRLPQGGLLAYAGQVTVAGALAMLFTSFRATRFLGEPERYVEATAPWAVLSGAVLLFSLGQWALLGGVCVAFLLLDLVQLYASTLVVRHVGDQTAQLGSVESVVRERLAGQVRFCSNNEQFTKMLMQNDWTFAYCLAVGQDYCGMPVREVFTVYPLQRRSACERIVATYRVNACLLDRSSFDTLFDQPPPGLRAMSVAYESARLRLLILDWAEPGV
jgi:hypothetical protein